MWNQKRKNLGLLTEVFFSFLVIFAVFTFLVHNFQRYQESTGFSYERVWTIRFSPNREKDMTQETHDAQVAAQLRQIDQVIKNYPEFEAYTFSSGNLPYTGNRHLVGMTYEGKETNPYVYATDERFPEVMKVSVEQGKWFSAADAAQEGIIPIVINRQFREYYFGDDNPLGKRMVNEDEATTHVVVGVIDNFKQQGEFSKTHPAFFIPRGDDPTTAMLIKVKPGTDAAVESRLFDDIQQITKGWTIDIRYMDDLRRLVLMETWIPSLLFLIICGFLIFNVALGLFGVVWQNINKRKQEIGVRRAMGATKLGIRGQIIGEIAVLATLSLILGVFFAVQFPLLKVFNLPASVYIIAILMAIVFIYLIVFICSFYPSLLAARLHPAVALHEE
jgi:putative ABC transport system permease protein